MAEDSKVNPVVKLSVFDQIGSVDLKQIDPFDDGGGEDLSNIVSILVETKNSEAYLMLHNTAHDVLGWTQVASQHFRIE